MTQSSLAFTGKMEAANGVEADRRLERISELAVRGFGKGISFFLILV